MRKIKFINNGFYHVFNRGVDKRNIFSDKYDVFRFLKDMDEFNKVEPVESIRNLERERKVRAEKRSNPVTANNKLVNIICYCLNPNHYHFILEQVSNEGISKFMHKLGSGYTRYFDEKYERSGVLFQGKFKAVHLESNEQLLHTSAYINLNNKVHKKFDGSKKHFIDLILNRSSWNEYIGRRKDVFCSKDIILGYFKSIKDYKKFVEETVKEIKEMRYGEE